VWNRASRGLCRTLASERVLFLAVFAYIFTIAIAVWALRKTSRALLWALAIASWEISEIKHLRRAGAGVNRWDALTVGI